MSETSGKNTGGTRSHALYSGVFEGFMTESNGRITHCKGHKCPGGGIIGRGDTSVILFSYGSGYSKRTRYCSRCGLRIIDTEIKRMRSEASKARKLASKRSGAPENIKNSGAAMWHERSRKDSGR